MDPFVMLFCCTMALPSTQEDPAEEVLGLTTSETLFLGEGPTDPRNHPEPLGTLKAVMLFANFPDGERDKSMQELHQLLVPGAVEYFERSSYGKFHLKVDAHFQWYDLAKASTDPGYDCSRHDSHKAYVAEVMSAADEEVDFSEYSLVYVVANKAPGTFNSPTLHAPKGGGIQADEHEIRHAVTFGNDIRGKDWGWQTLVHETGHVLGLPDLYSYDSTKGVYKTVHKFTGSWDPMGFQPPASHFLAWHKFKLSWLEEKHFAVVQEAGVRTLELSHIETDEGVKALVLPISATQAYVAEVRHLGEGRSVPGVLVYKVSIDVPSGRGPIEIMPAVPDDDGRHAELARKYIALYDALYFEGGTFEDTQHKIRLEVMSRSDAGYCVKSTR